MAQDIRELFKNDKGIPRNNSLNDGHQKRFEARLDAHFGKPAKTTPSYLWMKIAAVFIVLLAVGGLFFNKMGISAPVEATPDVIVATENQKPELQLSDLSPQFKKVEDFYMASINVELARLQITEVNKDLIDSFMTQMEELNTEYKKLNEDLIDVGINDQTVTALIDNLKLRLDLLFKLKQKMKDIKQDQEQNPSPDRI